MPLKQKRRGERNVGELGVTAGELVKLAESYGTPLFVTSEKRLLDNYSRLRDAFGKHYDDVVVRYAIKANSNPAIIKTLANRGAWMDASSPAEVEFALAAGSDKKRIMFSPNYVPRAELEQALDMGLVINFDSIGQFSALAKVGRPQCVSFRLNHGFGKGEFPGTTLSGPDSKFGIPDSRIVEAYRLAKEEGVKRFGMHMMCGSNVLEPEYFAAITSRILDTAGRLKSELDIVPEFIDIGGGFGVPYRPGEVPLDIEKAAQLVSREFMEKSARYGLGKPQLVIEPGRYLVADTTVLLGTVTEVKSYEKRFVGIDAGMNVLIRPALYGAYHQVVAVTKPDAPLTIKADVVGEICENTDAIARGIMLPEVTAGEDVLAVMNAGAYGYSMSSSYNGRLRPAEVMVTTNGKPVLIRRRETFRDLMSTVVLEDIGTRAKRE